MRHLILALLCIAVCASAIDWSQVTTSSMKLQENEDFSDCMCKKYSGKCTFGCACDEDCTTTAISNFGTNLPENGVLSGYNFRVCSSDAGIVSSSLDSSDLFEVKQVDDIFCISRINNPSLGDFYDVTSVYGIAEVNTLANDANYDTLLIPKSSNTALQSAYVYDHPLQTVVASKTATFSPKIARDANGVCNPAVVKYGIDSGEGNYCSIVKFGWEATADYEARLVTQMNTLLTPAVSDTPLASTTVAVTFVGNVYDTSGNSVSTLNAVPTITVAASVLSYSVEEVMYWFVHDESGTITQVNVTAKLVQTMAVQTQHTVKSAYEFGFNVALTDVWEQSGRPGYIFGKPILYGSKVTSGSQAAVQRDGDSFLSIPAAVEVCAGERSDVGFGTSTTTSCIEKFDEDTVANSQCETLRRTILTRLLSFDPTSATTSNERFAQWGSSSYLDITLWLELAGVTPTASSSSDVPGVTCSSIPNVMKYTVFYTPLGSKINPQYRILGVHRSFESFDLNVGDLQDDVVEVEDAGMLGLKLKSYVTFVQYPEKEAQPFVPPSASQLPQFPSDFFYPFVLRTV
ncbi:hypothetical protein PCE1_001241 [Barthelona sp. PCE]